MLALVPRFMACKSTTETWICPQRTRSGEEAVLTVAVSRRERLGVFRRIRRTPAVERSPGRRSPPWQHRGPGGRARHRHRSWRSGGTSRGAARRRHRGPWRDRYRPASRRPPASGSALAKLTSLRFSAGRWSCRRPTIPPRRSRSIGLPMSVSGRSRGPNPSTRPPTRSHSVTLATSLQ
jgi:hypothetical protein